MSTSPIQTDSLLNQLSLVEKTLNTQIQTLEKRRLIVHSTIQAFKDVASPVSVRKPVKNTTTKQKTLSPAKKGGTKRTLTATPTKKRGPRASGQTTMDMVRAVLNNRGSEMSFPEIREQIRRDFGSDPAKTLNQMLYKRAKNSTGLYRIPGPGDGRRGGRYGLTDWHVQQHNVAA